ncbi:MAG TPA: response regulator [Candidatus Dormibacteraeota bacterium]
MALSVVIVDDHAPFRSMARQLLEAGGFVVVGEAEDASSALEEVHRLHPALVLLDVQLPDLDGLTLASRLAVDEPGTAVVLTSSREAADYGHRVTSCGARGFITKADLSSESVTAVLRMT